MTDVLLNIRSFFSQTGKLPDQGLGDMPGLIFCDIGQENGKGTPR